MSYKELKVWQMARELTTDVHRMTLTALPRHEMYEEGSQFRRAIKSTRSNIVEGYGRRRYKNEFIRYLVMAHASCDEAKDHLEILHETGSLPDESTFADLSCRIQELSKAIGGFIRTVEERHLSLLDDSTRS